MRKKEIIIAIKIMLLKVIIKRINKYGNNYLKDTWQVNKGDTFILGGDFKQVEFKVVETDPEKFCVVDSQTVIFDERKQNIREDEEREDGGCPRKKKEMIIINHCFNDC